MKLFPPHPRPLSLATRCALKDNSSAQKFQEIFLFLDNKHPNENQAICK